jgi:arginyl-tRNA synthetase
MLCGQSEIAFNRVYELLSVDSRLQTRGESFYNPYLNGVIDTLRSAGMLEESDGANCVFLDGYTNRDGDRLPMIVQKSDGGFMYSTTDLAAVKHRVEEEKADRIIYVTDAGQSSHFDQVFQISRLAGLAPEGVSLEHVPFGLVLGEDGKKFKTRSGDTVKLMDLLDEAISRTRGVVLSRLEEDERSEDDDFVERLSRAMGIGAVKYADLAMNRQSDYRFSFDKMLSLKGNTAPYMMYAYARLRGIQRKTSAALAEKGENVDEVQDFSRLLPENLILETDVELALAKHLLRFAQAVRDVEKELMPSTLCLYLFDLSAKFNKFYEECPVLNAGSDELRKSRLALCELSASVLKVSLGLLGLEAFDRI